MGLNDRVDVWIHNSGIHNKEPFANKIETYNLDSRKMFCKSIPT
jgi:hypothetical protein